MTHLIELVCRKDHGASERQDFSPVLTVYERKWGWCVNSGDSNHVWDAVEPLSLDELRLRERAHRLEEVRAAADSESSAAESRE